MHADERRCMQNSSAAFYVQAVESTSDFYIRKQSPIVYLTIGEVESVGCRDLEMQLAIGALGMLAKRKTTKIGTDV